MTSKEKVKKRKHRKSVKESKQPERICIGCRTHQTRKEMLRVVLVSPMYSPWKTIKGGEDVETIAIDWKHKAPGRGAHVCIAIECLKRALVKGGIRRSFRKPLNLPDEEELMSEVREGLMRNFKERLSLARRSGSVSSGESAVEESVKSGRCRMLLLSREMSSGQQEKYKRNAERKGLPVSTSVSGGDLGVRFGESLQAL